MKGKLFLIAPLLLFLNTSCNPLSSLLNNDTYAAEGGEIDLVASDSRPNDSVIKLNAYRSPGTGIPFNRFNIDQLFINASGNTIIDGSIPDGLIHVIGDEFMMGDVMSDDWSENEKPVHKVWVNAYYINSMEVTFREFDMYCEATGKPLPDDNGWGRDLRPVINVSWYDAVEFCNWLSWQVGLEPVYFVEDGEVKFNFDANGYRLPTEAEWEYAAREEGLEVRFGEGSDIADPAKINYNGSKQAMSPTLSKAGVNRGKTLPVGSLNSPNLLEMHDMSGNVAEWCQDWPRRYKDEYIVSPLGLVSGRGRAVRGGSWKSWPLSIRCAQRWNETPDTKSNEIGFRIARRG